ncbi:MAG: M28 family peptidase [Anaerolineales bacterium]
MPRNPKVYLILIFVFLVLCALPPSGMRRAHAESTDAAYKLLVQEMLDQVDPGSVQNLIAELSGAQQVIIAGQPYTIETRAALSGEPAALAAQYLFQFYEDLGLQVEYKPFSFMENTLNNIIAQKNGSIFPERIFLITSHYDDVPVTGPAPGADDNASGTAGVMLAAKILNQYDFGCTLRFVNFGAEEYGLIGSKDYAQKAYCSGEDIQGVINLDMIAWNTPGSSPNMDLHALSSIPGSNQLAITFQDVVSEYNLDLIPELADPVTTRSDHASFWRYEVPAILVSEDWEDFNPHYHTSDDDLESLQDIDYFTSMIKASLGTLAQEGCLVEGGWGTISGQVVDSQTLQPVPGTSVWLNNPGWDFTQFTRSDSNGNYQFTALAGWNTLTVDGLGYTRSELDVLILKNQDLEQSIQIETLSESAIYLPLSANIRHAPLPGCP